LDARFDRSYEYDFAGRLSLAKTGLEARGQTETNVENQPYRESFGYDAFGHVSSRDTYHFGFHVATGNTFVNNRNTTSAYDESGNIWSEGTTTYGFDAAGRTVQVSTYQTDQSTQFYDGDGQVLKQVDYGWNDQTNDYSTTPGIYKVLIRSSVLGGQVVSEADSGGHKLRTYVYAGTAKLAWQSIWGQGANQTEVVVWEHRDPINSSFRTTTLPGQGSYYYEDAQPAELDPAGANVGLSSPYVGGDPPPNLEESLNNYPSFSDPAHPTLTFSMDGIRMPYDTFMLQLGFYGKNPMALLDLARGSRLIINGDFGYRRRPVIGDLNSLLSVLPPQKTGPHNTKTVPMQTEDELREQFKKLLANRRCAEFVSALIRATESKMRDSQRLDLGSDPLNFEDLFESIVGQGGYALVDGLRIGTLEVNGTIDGGIWSNDAVVQIRTRGYITEGTPKMVATMLYKGRRSYLATAFHETFHHLARSRWGSLDSDLGRAAFAVTGDTTMLPGNDGTESQWSDYFDEQLMQHCMPDQVRTPLRN